MGLDKADRAPWSAYSSQTFAKYMALRYSNEGDTIGDYSCGFGGRLLGAASCGRKYIGTDPLTVPELKNMVSCFGLKDCELIQDGSENYRGKENSIDLYWSSPPDLQAGDLFTRQKPSKCQW